MNSIRVTANSSQRERVFLPDGSSFTIELVFKPMQYGWFIRDLTYTRIDGEQFQIKGLRVCTSPNMLFQFKNQIPFGLACYTVGNEEPTLQEDFSSGRSGIFLLTEAEVEALTEKISGQA